MRSAATVKIKGQFRSGGQWNIAHGESDFVTGDRIIWPGDLDFIFGVRIGRGHVGNRQCLRSGSGDRGSAVLQPLECGRGPIGTTDLHGKNGIVALQDLLRERLLADANLRLQRSGDSKIINPLIFIGSTRASAEPEPSC